MWDPMLLDIQSPSCRPAHTDVHLDWFHSMPATFLGWRFFSSRSTWGDQTGTWQPENARPLAQKPRRFFKETKCDRHMLSILILVFFIGPMREKLRGEQSLNLSSLPNHQTKILYPSQSRDIKSDISVLRTGCPMHSEVDSGHCCLQVKIPGHRLGSTGGWICHGAVMSPGTNSCCRV